MMWDEMLNAGLKPELETFNHLISIASFVMESSQKQWEFVEVSRAVLVRGWEGSAGLDRDSYCDLRWIK